MSAFSADNISKAIARVPSTASKDLRVLLDRAKAKSITTLIEAVETELVLRGPKAFDAIEAEKHVEWSNQAAGMDLAGAIKVAFTANPMNSDERGLTRQIATNPGITYRELTEHRGKGDVGLILGHMVYERLGFFRRFLLSSSRMSDLLFVRDESGGGISYRLSLDAANAFTELGILDQAS